MVSLQKRFLRWEKILAGKLQISAPILILWSLKSVKNMLKDLKLLLSK